MKWKLLLQTRRMAHVAAVFVLTVFLGEIPATYAQLSQDDRGIAQELVAGILANEMRMKKYSYAVDLKMHNYDLTLNPDQLSPEGELAVFVDHDQKFWIRTLQRESIHNNQLIVSPLRTEFSKKGECFYRIIGRDIAMPPSKSIPVFEPFEIAITNFNSFQNGESKAGMLLDFCDDDKLVSVEEITDKRRGELVRLIYQYTPMGRIYVTFAEQLGRMPIYLEVRSTFNGRRSNPSNDESDYRKILSTTSTEWKNRSDLWVPTRVQLTLVQSPDRLKRISDRKLRFHWWFNDKLTMDDVEKFVNRELYDLIVENAQVKGE